MDQLQFPVPLHWGVNFIGPEASHTAVLFGLDSVLQFALFSGFWHLIFNLMSEPDSSSDTTHEAILHNLVTHQRNLQRQVSRLEEQIQALQLQIQAIHSLLQQVFGRRDTAVSSSAKADRGNDGSQ